METKAIILLASVLMVTEVLGSFDVETRWWHHGTWVPDRGGSAGSSSGASNTNNIKIDVHKVCRDAQNRKGKREVDDFEKRGRAGSGSKAKNINNIDISGMRDACRALGYRV